MRISTHATLLGFSLFALSVALHAEQPAVKGPFLDSSEVTWKVNDFPVARWKTLVGGIEGGQIEQADVQFGLWELAPYATYHGHRHEVPEIYHVISGEGQWSVGANSQRVGPGATIYTAPGKVHKMINLGAEPLRTVWFWWAPGGRSDVFSGAYEFTETPPQQPTTVVPWTAEQPK